MKRILPLILSTGCLLAQPRPAQIKIDTDRTIGEVDPHLFGNFTEHLGRCIYGGIFAEGSPLSDADGFRKDVMDAGCAT
jgi:alpha-N-arabinofuranosidase